jgi:hypothetical protein
MSTARRRELLVEVPSVIGWANMLPWLLDNAAIFSHRWRRGVSLFHF